MPVQEKEFVLRSRARICSSFLVKAFIQGVERREKQRGQVRIWDLEKLFDPLSRVVATAHSSTGCVCTSRTDLMFRTRYLTFLYSRACNLEQATCNCSSKDGFMIWDKGPRTALDPA
ncbi:hypothetical protein LH53_10020 [Mesotoga sp. TolDC]|nr:hypothetical protein LH53_11560 [Mesotoga sp. TolDC]PZC51629.1 hypothetical protein LH53_10020 [Mesotoga sp. TolDC]